MTTSTISRWTDLLDIAYQLIRVPAYSVNCTSRLTKKPKLYWSDTAMAMHLAGNAEPSGAHLENIVLADLNAWCGSQSIRPVAYQWRTVLQQEVDFVVEMPTGQVLPTEVKATTTPGTRDAAGLRAFLSEYGELAVSGRQRPL